MRRRVLLAAITTLLAVGMFFLLRGGESPPREMHPGPGAIAAADDAKDDARDGTAQPEPVAPTDGDEPGEPSGSGAARPPHDGPTPADAAGSGARSRGQVMVPDGKNDVAGTAGTLDKEAVMKGVAAAKPKIQDCYERALKVQPELMGRVVMEFKIESTPDDAGTGSRGTVTSGEVRDTDMASPFFEACVLQEVAGTTFEAPSGGGTVTVRYPFHFESTADAGAPP